MLYFQFNYNLNVAIVVIVNMVGLFQSFTYETLSCQIALIIFRKNTNPSAARTHLGLASKVTSDQVATPENVRREKDRQNDNDASNKDVFVIYGSNPKPNPASASSSIPVIPTFTVGANGRSTIDFPSTNQPINVDCLF